MNAREVKGRQIAATGRVRRKGDLYVVPSASSGSDYVVDLAAEDGPTCTCTDYEQRRARCKHIEATFFTIIQESTDDDGAKVVTITRVKRTTYRQPSWPAYHAAQENEREHFADLLRGLCEGIQQPQQGRGRPRHHFADVIFGLVWRTFSGKSLRRMMGELREMQERGNLETVPHFNSLTDYIERADVTPLLKLLIEESALPLRAVERDFAVDSSGFTTAKFNRWFDEKYGRMRSEHQWLKVHAMVGVKTHAITAVEITGQDGADSPQFPGLVASTAARFNVRDITADKAYLSKENLRAVVAVGGTPYVPFKSNSSGGKGSTLWSKMFHTFHAERETFLAHYHARSNCETAFSMIKGKFGETIRSRTPTAQVNEILCKILCHNICCLIKAIYELKLEPKFWQPLDGSHDVN